MTNHHPKPRSRGGTLKQTIRICQTCHQVLHYCIDIEKVCLYDNVEKLHEHSQYKIYIDWIRTKDNQSMYKVKNIKEKYLPKLKFK